MRAFLADTTISDVDVTRVGEGFGFESEVARVDVRGPTGRRSLAIKFCSAEAARDEQHSYAVVLPPTSVSHAPLVAAFDDGERGLVVLEFVDGEQGDVLHGCEPRTAVELVETIAGLHAAWWQADLPAIPMLDPQLRRSFPIEAVDRCVAEYGDVLSPASRRVLCTLPERIDELADALAGHPTTVVHGDLHLDNVIIDAAGGVTILDWPRPRRAPAAIDVARCFVEVVDAHPDDEVGTELIARYHGRLTELGVRGYDVRDLRDAVQLAQLLFAPGVIRWAINAAPDRSDRQIQLLHHAIERIGALIV